MVDTDRVVSGLAAYGKVKSILSTIIAVLGSLLFFGIGITWGRSSQNDPHTLAAAATLKNVGCSSTFTETKHKDGTVTKQEQVTCTADATYTVNGTSYTAQRLTFSSMQQEGARVGIWYNPVNPNDVISQKPVPAFVGYMIAAVACAVAIMSIVYTYLLTKSTTFAAVHGTKEAVDDVGDIFRGLTRRGGAPSGYGNGRNFSW